MKEIFDFQDYRDYLKAWIDNRPEGSRGQRSELAKAIGGPVSHISQVLSGISNLSFEQAEELNSFLGHSTDEAEFFLQLLQLARAGTPKLKARVNEQIKRIREKRHFLKDRLAVKASISSENQAQFYSTWLNAAIHVALTVDRLRSKEALAEYFNLSLTQISEMLEFMMGIGLVTHENGQYLPGQARMHLGADSPVISKHHINWRLRAMQSLDVQKKNEDLHYSSVVSISKEDSQVIKSMLVSAIEKAKITIRESPAEELYSFCLDFFKV